MKQVRCSKCGRLYEDNRTDCASCGALYEDKTIKSSIETVRELHESTGWTTLGTGVNYRTTVYVDLCNPYAGYMSMGSGLMGIGYKSDNFRVTGNDNKERYRNTDGTYSVPSDKMNNPQVEYPKVLPPSGENSNWLQKVLFIVRSTINTLDLIGEQYATKINR
jgi:hypothetical protein